MTFGKVLLAFAELGRVKTSFDAGHIHEAVGFLTPGAVIFWTTMVKDGHVHVGQAPVTIQESQEVLAGRPIVVEFMAARNLSDGKLHLHRMTFMRKF